MKKIVAALTAFFISYTAFGYSFDPKLPKDVANQIRQDLEWMATVQGDQVSQLHQGIFGAMNGSGYKNWFETRVTYIGYNSCGGGNAVACVIPFMGSSKMWITDNYIKFSHPQVSRLMVVYHEARHTETRNRNWPHANCPDPFLDENGNEKKSIWTGAPLAGEPACDTTPQGSYGSSMILLKNISKFCGNCSEKVKMDAGIYADDQFGRVISDSARKAIQDDLYKR